MTTIIEELAPQVEGPVTSEQAEIAALRLSNQQLRNDLILAREQHANDIQLIGERLIEESEGRNWCHEFDQIIDEVNEKLTGPNQLPLRMQKFEVEVRVSAVVSSTYFTTVTARSEEEAESIILDDPHAHFDPDDYMLDVVRNHGFDEVVVESY